MRDVIVSAVGGAGPKGIIRCPKSVLVAKKTLWGSLEVLLPFTAYELLERL